MTESESPATTRRIERAFLDANVIRGQLTTDVLLSIADRGVFEPRWTREVIDELRRNRPSGVSEQAIDRRIARMNGAFEDAMIEDPPQQLQDQMHADRRDKHVLAGAVHSESTVLVTENVKDFDPPSSGQHAMRVEKLNQFLIRKLDQDPRRVQAALQEMVARNQHEPRSMPALIDRMAEGHELRDFARRLNTTVPPDQRGTSQMLAANQRGSAQHAALDGVAEPGTPKPPGAKPETRKTSGSAVEREKNVEQDR